LCAVRTRIDRSCVSGTIFAPDENIGTAATQVGRDISFIDLSRGVHVTPTGTRKPIRPKACFAFSPAARMIGATAQEAPPAKETSRDPEREQAPTKEGAMDSNPGLRISANSRAIPVGGVLTLLACATFSSAAWAQEVSRESASDADRERVLSLLGRAIVSRPIVIEPPDGMNTAASDVNNAGTVVGTHFSGEFTRAFAWSREQGFRALETDENVEFPFSVALGVNECGVIVGESSLPGAFGSHAVRWINGEVEDLGTLGGDNSFANDVNERGQVVGGSFVDAGFTVLHAFLWTEDEGMIDLGTLGGDFSIADAINNRGEVTGSSSTADGEEHAFFWSRRTGMIDLGTRGEEMSRAFALNDRSQVAMLASGDLGNIARGFRWTRKRGFTELRPLVDWAFPRSINHHGFLGGDSLDANDTRRATLWPFPRLVIPIDPQIGETDSGLDAVNEQYAVGSATFNGGDAIRAVVWKLRVAPDRKHQRELERLCRKSG
jgi:probable HAF family extracellular repeat protein